MPTPVCVAGGHAVVDRRHEFNNGRIARRGRGHCSADFEASESSGEKDYYGGGEGGGDVELHAEGEQR